MNKTWKTILKILGYVISFLLTKDKGEKEDVRSKK